MTVTVENVHQVKVALTAEPDSDDAYEDEGSRHITLGQVREALNDLPLPKKSKLVGMTVDSVVGGQRDKPPYRITLTFV